MYGGESDPTEVFGPVGNSTRVEILRALRDAYSESPNDPWLEYTELRAAVGIDDNGNFNYHLDRLDDLVVKRPAGYRISRIGMQVVSAVSSGVFDSDWTWGPVDAPGDCLFCDAPVRLYYEDGVLRFACETDDHALALSVPPSLLDSGPDGNVIERIAFAENQWAALTRREICAECWGYVEGEVVNDDEHPEQYHYRGRCRRCGFQHGLPIGLLVLGHPAVGAFYHDHGVDVRTTPYWTLEFCEPGHETVLSTEPLRLRVDVTHADDALSLTLDRAGSVVSTDRP